jgi:hypothetical protein
MGEADQFAIVASPDCVAPGGRVEATWTAPEYEFMADIIALFPAAARNDEYEKYEWDHVNTVGGRRIFPAPSTPGEYEFRLVRDNTHLAVSQPITVQGDCPARAISAPLEGYSAPASPECVAPGGRLEVTWTAVESFDVVALLPAAARNDEYDKNNNQYSNVSTTGGGLIFPAPLTPGEYEFRLLNDGTHVAVSQPITVSNDCGP